MGVRNIRLLFAVVKLLVVVDFLCKFMLLDR